MTTYLERLPAVDGTRPITQRVRMGNHELVSDVSLAEGGTDDGPSPHDLYDAALGTCKALTVLWYARKRGIPVDDVRTAVERDDSEERKGVYRLAVKLQVSGDLTEAQLQELANVADKCPVHKLMTKVTTEVSTQLERLP